MQGSPGRDAGVDTPLARLLVRGSFIAPALDADGIVGRFASTQAARALAGRDEADVRAAAVFTQQRLAAPRDDTTGAAAWLVADFLSGRTLRWTAEETVALLELAAEGAPGSPRQRILVRLPAAAAARLSARDAHRVVAPARALLERLLTRPYGRFPEEEMVLTRCAHTLAGLLCVVDDTLPVPLPLGPDGWAAGLRTALGEPCPLRSVRLMLHLGKAGTASPSRVWRSATAELLTSPDAAQTVQVLLRSLAAVPAERGADPLEADHLLHAANRDLARGAVWATASLSGDWVAPLLGDVAVLAGVGWSGGGDMREGRVANACVAALGDRADDAAVAQLLRVRAKVRNKPLLKQLAGCLERVAAAAGLTRDDLEERAVPGFGLDADGRLERALGDHVAVVAASPTAATLSFRAADGRVRATAPAAVRQQHPEALAHLRGLAKEIGKALPAERARIEGLLVGDRRWRFAQWAVAYRDHPLTARFGSGLLWELEVEPGTWVAGWPDGRHLTDADGAVLAQASGDTPVRLWHPLHAGDEVIARWRAILMDRRLRQPLKQVFREVYRLTPQEQVSDRSTRFAGHVVIYRQMAALLRERGWSGRMLGDWDGGDQGEAARELQAGNWRAEFTYDSAVLPDDDGPSPSLAAMGPLRFTRLRAGSWDAAPLAEVPPLVLSEALRDVDLFTSVSSIGTDPQWADRAGGRHRDHWRAVGLGPLGIPGETRRDALARILPSLPIAFRCELGDRFLRVRGDLGSYRIHLGSGAVLRDPGDVTLQIVARPDPRRAKVFLPFEEAGLLATIVSTALLLADDRAAADLSIVAQLERG